uniref:Uncharacterized protein n=2 Tax=unclassified Caudoviricetes TaxID=2788787 RepID=A0A8S5Q8L3_9CAUD|nr:MAG TPA: hypothetical protein [Siphoviridae sp. ctAvK3]DAE15161.1 MAG TPA: hypothetical protein [Siphoviridae sp. ctdVv30]
MPSTNKHLRAFTSQLQAPYLVYVNVTEKSTGKDDIGKGSKWWFTALLWRNDNVKWAKNEAWIGFDGMGWE